MVCVAAVTRNGITMANHHSILGRQIIDQRVGWYIRLVRNCVNSSVVVVPSRTKTAVRSCIAVITRCGTVTVSPRVGRLTTVHRVARNADVKSNIVFVRCVGCISSKSASHFGFRSLHDKIDLYEKRRKTNENCLGDYFVHHHVYDDFYGDDLRVLT